MRETMSEKKVIQNLVNLINEKYRFADSDGIELRIHANPNLNGWELWLHRVNGGGVAVMLTQYEQVPGNVAVLILKMLFYDILERQIAYGYYKVERRA